MSSLVSQRVQSLPTTRETQVQSLGWKNPLEKEMATSIPAWRIPQMEEPGRLGGYSPWGCKELGTTEQLKLDTTFTSLPL